MTRICPASAELGDQIGRHVDHGETTRLVVITPLADLSGERHRHADRGVEIDRRPLFQAEDQLDHCYITPSGSLIYGKPPANCQPAEAWKR
ncbi:hypothetical protein C1I99_23630 [Micromonospora deserti]|uniref:Uncharacterized protein n=1 Tax=Micromonospora deserti TaxID=2070366 RepID=A0A2W2C096_9ACTN|nr:hypothetical protein C1I99_23630 [Micromonospora deserti]